MYEANHLAIAYGGIFKRELRGKADESTSATLQVLPTHQAANMCTCRIPLVDACAFLASLVLLTLLYKLTTNKLSTRVGFRNEMVGYRESVQAEYTISVIKSYKEELKEGAKKNHRSYHRSYQA